MPDWRLLPLLLSLALPAPARAQGSYGQPEPEADLSGPGGPARAYQIIAIGSFDLEKPARPLPGEVDLGRLLFFDRRLSKNGTISCADCHDPAKAWADGRKRALGSHGKDLERNTPSLYASRRNIKRKFFWDGRAEYLEDAIHTAMTSRLEMGADSTAFDAAMHGVPAYLERFAAVYGKDSPKQEQAARALAAYVRAAADPGEIPFDRFSREPGALTKVQQRGMVVFAGKGKCAVCHLGPYFSDDYYHNTGLKRAADVDDVGRYAVEPKPSFWRAFKTPPLRNVAQTAPYMHDGRLPTLEAVIDYYDKGGEVDRGQDPDNEIAPLQLTKQEKSDLLAFLRSLTGPGTRVERPKLP